MSRLFIELYLDEDVDVNVAILIRRRGFSAITTHEAGKLRASDAEQLAYAVKYGNAILTHNRNDFLTLATTYHLERKEHCGIIIARRRTPQEIVQRLVLLLNSVTADEFQNQVRYI
jgi:predicted nuclease of predicted toxin-antitoxin system